MASLSRHFLRDLWALTRPYWQSEERWASGGLLGIVIVLNLGAVYLNVLFNEWNNLFYNALQDRDWAAFTHQFIRFGYLAALFIAVAVYRIYLRQMLQIRWRRWLTQRYVGDWMKGRAYYRLQLAHAGRTDNPDQRISEDINSFVGQTLVLGLGLMESVVTLVSFAAILWNLSGSLDLGFASVPGYMLWVALLYAAGGTYLTHLIGRPLIGLNFQQQQYEADFRFSLVRLRENAEGVALYGGESAEADGLARRFTRVVGNWWAIMRRQKRLTWFSAGYGQIALVFPFLVAAPRYFSGAIQLGGLMQTASAFGQVQGALSWFVDAYSSLAEWRATVDRLTSFTQALFEMEDLDDGIRRIRSADGSLKVENLTLNLPDGEALLSGQALTLRPGETVLVSGPSGCGKSTLFRAIAGLWPYGQGIIALPAGRRLLFLPQRPYLPILPLGSAVAYPDPVSSHPAAEIVEVLNLCGLPHLAGRLDEERHWAQELLSRRAATTGLRPCPADQARLAVPGRGEFGPGRGGGAGPLYPADRALAPDRPCLHRPSSRPEPVPQAQRRLRGLGTAAR